MNQGSERTTPQSFTIVKHYHDLIDDKGNCMVLYRAMIKFCFLRLYYSAWIHSDFLNNLHVRSSLKKSEYKIKGNTSQLVNNDMKLKGKWIACDKPLPGFSYTDRSGRVLSWHCENPKSEATVCLDGYTYKGYGYEDTIVMSIWPRDIPIAELRWGRFHSGEYAVIWVRWEGQHPVNRLYFNGEEINDAVFTANGLTFLGGIYSVSFLQPVVVRSGSLMDSLRGTGLLRVLFRRNIIDAIETKYKSRSLLQKNGILISTGWSLYEVVKWKH